MSEFDGDDFGDSEPGPAQVTAKDIVIRRLESELASKGRMLEKVTAERDAFRKAFCEQEVSLAKDKEALIQQRDAAYERYDRAFDHAQKSDLQVRELEAVYARYQEKLGRAKAALRAVAQDAEKHSGWWSRTTAQTALDALDGTENRVDAPPSKIDTKRAAEIEAQFPYGITAGVPEKRHDACIDCGKPVTSGNICLPCIRVRYPSKR